ncbi:MADS-box 15 [Zea mays]|uniref:MADS-box 15 n=1 Tax=Zea mays TaxID=4577 RepID=A0A1D6GGX5_MAIZE|nr:MADS-box 15 [Zea mays]AQK62792.1 MADS-box 15 [Zea mays]
MLDLSSTKAGARMKETTLFGHAGGLHTQISTSAGGSKSIDETWWLDAQAACWCSDELINKCSFRTARLTRKPRAAACRRTTACSCDDGHGVALEAIARCFSPRRDCTWRRAKNPRAAV